MDNKLIGPPGRHLLNRVSLTIRSDHLALMKAIKELRILSELSFLGKLSDYLLF